MASLMIQGTMERLLTSGSPYLNYRGNPCLQRSNINTLSQPLTAMSIYQHRTITLDMILLKLF